MKKHDINMFGFTKNMFIGLFSVYTIGSFCKSLVSNSKGSIKCLTLNNRPYQARPTILNINSNETQFYPFTVSVKNYGGTYNTIDVPYTRVFVPSKAKNMNVKVFNLMPGVNETIFLLRCELCE